MSKQDLSLIATEPFVQEFVLRIIQNIRARNFSYEKAEVINADLVPRFSEKVVLASLGEKAVPRVGRREIERELVTPIEKVMVKRKPVVEVPEPGEIAPVVVKVIPKVGVKPVVEVPESRVVAEPTRRVSPMPVRAPVASQKVIAPQQMAPKIEAKSVSSAVKPIAPVVKPVGSGETKVESGAGYKKIVPLLGDPSVSMIECPGADKTVSIVRMGMRQPTRIVLSLGDVDDILDVISDKAHIPLLEGVFRAAVDDYSVNAVISKVIGSRFVIKKAQGAAGGMRR